MMFIAVLIKKHTWNFRYSLSTFADILTSKSTS